MKKARRNGFIKITAILLACIVSVGMLPMSYGTSSADAADSDDYVSGSDLKATLYTYDGDTPVYYHSDWTQGEIYVEVEGETDKEVTGAFYKKNGDSDWTSANVNVTPIEAELSTEPQPTEEPTETATVSSSESGRTADEESAVQEEVGEPEDQEPAPAEITGYKVASDFWVTEPNGTYEIRFGIPTAIMRLRSLPTIRAISNLRSPRISREALRSKRSTRQATRLTLLPLTLRSTRPLPKSPSSRFPRTAGQTSL